MALSAIRRALTAITAVLATATTAAAHPHVWVDAAAALIVEDGKVVAIRHGWSFDPEYTKSMTAQYDSNKDGRLSPEELAPLDQINIAALKQFQHFTDVRANGTKVPVEGPHNYKMRYVGARLAVQFEVRLESPVQLSELQLDVFDSTFFTVFTFLEEKAIQLEGATPAGCVAVLKQSPAGSEYQKSLKLFKVQSGPLLKGVNLGNPRTVSVSCPDPELLSATAAGP